MNTKHVPRILIAAVLVALVALTGCNLTNLTGSGTVVSQEYDFTDFSEVDISNEFTVDITPGNTYSVVVRIDDNLVDRLLVDQEGNRVRIGLKKGTVVTKATMEAEITMPQLTWLNASGAVQVQLNGFELNDSLIAEASGASNIHGDLAAIDLELEASGASNITLAGSGANVQARASGASKIDLEALPAVDAQTEASGASTVIVNIVGILDADASGSSNIYYVGNPEMGEIQTSGSSGVSQR